MEYLNYGSFFHTQDISHPFNFKKDYKTPGCCALYYFLVFSSTFERAVEIIEDYKKTTNSLNLFKYSAITDGTVYFPPSVTSGSKEPSGTYFIVAQVIEENKMRDK